MEPCPIRQSKTDVLHVDGDTSFACYCTVVQKTTGWASGTIFHEWPSSGPLLRLPQIGPHFWASFCWLTPLETVIRVELT
jgi:hypothetical protein